MSDILLHRWSYTHNSGQKCLLNITFFLSLNLSLQTLGIGEGFIIGTFQIWGPILRPVSWGEGPKIQKGSNYKTFSSIKFSSNFLSISFWPFLPSFQFCLLYFLIVIKATTESPETPQWETSRGTRTTPKGTWKYTTENWAGLYCYGMTLSNEQGGSVYCLQFYVHLGPESLLDKR
jgi:hypothetical protein